MGGGGSTTFSSKKRGFKEGPQKGLMFLIRENG